MRMGQGVRTGLGHGGITCVLQTQFSSFLFFNISIHCDTSLEPSNKGSQHMQDSSYKGSQYVFLEQ